MDPSVVEPSEEGIVGWEGLVRFLGADVDPGAVWGCDGVADQYVSQDEEDESAEEFSSDELTWWG